MRELDPTGRRPLIWIVDDSATEAAITERALRDHYELERFVDGSVVVERLGSTTDRPDLLLCDWVMPAMSGGEVCRFLRAQAATADLPIIIVTASRIETQDIVEGLAVGANDYVPRPFAPEELRARIDVALRAKRLQDATTRERRRLDAVNRLATALFRAGSSIDVVIDKLAEALTSSLCDGCAVMLLPGPMTGAPVARHRKDPTGTAMAAIGALADPGVHDFASDDEARAALPPPYHPYVDRFGLRGLAIMPFPTRVPLQGVVTLTRDRGAEAFDADDLVAIETAIEYAALAIETGLRHDAERVGRAQLNAVLSNLPIGIMVTDHQGVLTMVNGAVVALIPDIEHAKDLDDVFALARWAAVDGSEVSIGDWIVGRALHAHLATRAEMVLTPHTGEPPRVVSISGVPLLDGHNRVTGSVTVFQDVSAERAIEAERERVTRFQQEMLGIVGHDLRGPLGAISLATELLDERTHDQPEAKPLLRRIGASTRRMSTMVDQLLDVTRVRLGSGITIEPREVELLELVKGAIDECSLAHPRTRFTLVAGDVVTGSWDPERLEQVVSNLLANAAQYGHHDAAVEVEVHDRGDTVAIVVRNRVRDQPIPPELLATLFDPFRRGRARGPNENSSGLGLGLYIVDEIVRTHGGRITVSSTAESTVFEVTLPRRSCGA